MRILICTTDGGGNVPPTIAISRALLERGHEVRVLCGPYFPMQQRSAAMEAKFADAGIEVVYPSQETWAEGAGTIPDVSAIPEHLEMSRTMSLWMPVAVPWAAQATQQIKEYRPDLVVTDLTLPGAGIAAEAAGVPAVMLETTVPVHRVHPGLPVPGRGGPPGDDGPERIEEFEKLSRDVSMTHLNAARQRVGLPPDENPWAWEDRTRKLVILSSHAFDFAATSYPDNYVYTGSARPAPPTGEWHSPWPDDLTPTVLVSGTTTGLSGLWYGAFQGSANALIELGIRGLVTVGPLDPQMLPQSDILEYRAFVPHSDVLPHTAAMVTQCGHGSTIAALRHGVPLVCAPLFADQPDIAARVVHHGAGVRLSTRSSAAEYRDAIREVVNDPKYREAARSLGEKMADEDGIHEAANQIESAAG